MASNEWLVRKLHEQDKKIEALSRGGTGVGHTSIAPGENLTVISDNGEVVLGAGGVEHVDGPTPATPSAPTLKLGFGTIETTWGGTFAEGEDEDGVPLTAPVDFDVVEVHCSTDPEEEEWGEDTMRGQIKAREGGTITVGGFDVDDEVFVCLIALAKTGKRSAPSATASLVIEGLDFSQLFTEIDAANATIKNAGEVLVTEQDTLNDKLDDAFGQIDDAVASANGKNVVHYEDRAPTVDDAGTEGDTWFVGQVGRPNDVIEATNLAQNPSMANLGYQLGTGNMYASAGTALIVSADWAASGGTALEIKPAGTTRFTAAIASQPDDAATGVDAGKTFTVSANFHLETAQTGDLSFDARAVEIRVRVGSTTTTRFARAVASNTVGDNRVSVTFTLPSDLHSWHILLWNGSQNESAYWDSLDIAEISAPRPYFDGDTPSGTTNNDSHYRWTGEPHASTSEKYLPATEGLSSNWNVTEQYRFVNGAWENVELSHTVLSSLDLGKLVAGSAAIKEAVVQKLWAEVVVTKMAVAEQFIGENAILTGAVTAPKITASEELWAKIAQFVKIRAEHIEADAIDGMVITGATYRTSGGSGSWSDAGLFIAQPDGTSMVRFPTDGSPLSLTASDTQIERATVDDIDLTNGTIRSGGTFNLASGVTPPASPPEITTRWDKLCTLPKPSERSDYANLAYWSSGNSWVRAINALGTGEGDRIEIYDFDTGELTDSFPIMIDPHHGVTIMGDTVYIMGKDHDIDPPRVFIFGYDLNTGARTSRHEYTRGIQAKNALGNDGTNLIIASVYNRRLWVHLRNPVTGAQVGSDMLSGENTWPPADASDLFGISVNSAGTEFTVVPTVAARVYSVSGGTLTHKPDPANVDGLAGWVNPHRQATGCAWVNGTPYPVDAAGNIYAGATTASGYAVELCYTWYNGTHETAPSPVATINVAPRERITISLPARAGLQKRLYLRNVGVGGNWSRSTVPADVTVSTVPLGLPSFTPPSSSTFPNGTPAVLKSTNDKFVVSGDGSGHWGHFNVDTNGVMSGLIVTGWATCYIDPNYPNNAKKFTIQLPPGRFTKPPVVWASVSTSGPQLCSVGIVRQEISTTEFSLWFHRTSATETGVTWYAMDDSEA